MKHTVFMLLLICCTVLTETSAQQTPAKTSNHGSTIRGAITGRVVGPDGLGMADAEVSARRISEGEESNSAVASDEDGNFTLAGLAPGAYRLLAKTPGYVSADLPLESDIHRIGENVIINLVKGGVITGQVTDDRGEPLIGVTVSQERIRTLEGKQAGTPRSSSISLSEIGRTDDRGIYRIFGLRPGIYLVSINGGSTNSTDDVQIWREAPTYYPSATRKSAVEILLHNGEEVSGIDIRHRGERGHIVSGTITGDPELSSDRVVLKGIGAASFSGSSYVSKTRGFAFFGVPDGEYELTVAGGQGNETAAAATRRITVREADLNGVELKLEPTGSITGRIIIEASKTQRQGARQSVVEEVVLRAARYEPNQPLLYSDFTAPNKKGEFALKNLGTGQYRLAVDLPDESWQIRAIKQNGNLLRNGIAIKPGDKLSGIDVIIADDAAILDGRVVPPQDELPSRLAVFLIPSDSAGADEVIRYSQVEIRDDGSFQFNHIIPGKYLIYARQLTEKEADEYQATPLSWDAAEREKLRRAALAKKNEIELRPCEKVKDYAFRYHP